METFGDVLIAANLIAYAALGVLCLRLWLRRRDKPAFWASLAFSDLAFALMLSRLPEEGSAIWEFIDTLVVAFAALFPYFLYRVALAFAPGGRFMHWLAAGLTALVFIWAAVVPRFPGDAEPRSLWYRIFLLALLVQWSLCSALVATRFWRGGTGQPAVTRKRMRVLSVAAAAFTVALILALAISDAAPIADIAAFLFALGSAGMFYLALAPPGFLRSLWRRESEENLRRAVIDLMGSVTDEAVVEGLLPHAAQVIGAEGVALLDPEGRVIGAHGEEKFAWTEVLNLDEAALEQECLTKLDFAFGSLVVKTAPYTSFFGRDEIELLGALGVMTNLALERVRASEMRLELAEAQIRKQQALQINDNVVQGLAVAKYAFDLGDNDKAKEAIEGTLAAARKIISDLLDEVSTEEVFGPAALTRDNAATGFVKKNR